MMQLQQLRGQETTQLSSAPGQVTLSSANCCVQRLGGCNNHLKGKIKAPLNEILCPLAHLMLCGLFKKHVAECALNVCPQSRGGLSERGLPAAGEMEKGPFSVEWLAQSSRGRARPTAPRSPTGDIGGRENAANRAGSREIADRNRPGHEAEAGAGTARPRTKFSATQLQELERSFREQRYIGAREKRRLAAMLNLSQSQVKTWFQNRRMKLKRQTQDARVEALFSGLFLPYRCYPDIATFNCFHGMDGNISSTSLVSLHPAMPSPALSLPSVAAQSLHPVLPSLALLLPSSRGLSCYSSAIPAMTLTDDHKGLRFQPYLPSC